MPVQNSKKTKDELLSDFQRQTKADSDASLASKSSGQIYTGKKPKNLLSMIYDDKLLINTSDEKSRLINQYFADLFDPEFFKWSIRNKNGEELDFLVNIFKKYLQNKLFALKFWTAKFKSGVYGNYAFLLTKELTGKTYEGLPATEVNITPVKVNYKNSINEQITEIEVEYEDYSFKSGKSIMHLRRLYKIGKKGINQIPNFYKDNEILENQYWETDWRNKFKDTILDFDFIPVAVLKNNIEESPRMNAVLTRLAMLDKYDEAIAILPDWERGGIMFNGKPTRNANNERENFDFMKNLVTKGFVEFDPIDMDGQVYGLSDNVVTFSPTSNMKTVIDSRNTIMKEIREDIGMPSADEIKSAQQSTAEIIARQFLTSPQLEREKMLVKTFLKDFAYKFMTILKECNIPEFVELKPIDMTELVFDVDFDLNTDKNINQTIQQAKAQPSESSLGLANNTPTTIQENNIEENEVTNNESKNLLQRIWKWITRR